ncbi:MAG: hypothetical protein ACPGUV_04445 [Polyangiales bacterium]
MRAQHLRARAATLAAQLYAAGATRVRLVGSLAEPMAHVHLASDIDLCVWGLARRVIDDFVFACYAQDGALVDILRGEDLSPEARRLVEDYGEAL